MTLNFFENSGGVA